MSETTYRYTTTLSTLTCGECAIPFAVPVNFHDRVRDNGRKFWCPNGHNISYHQSEADRLRKKLKAAEAKQTSTQDQLQAAEAESEQHRRTILKERARFANGVCPCCNRSFTNVRRHMETKHPDYDVTRVGHKGPVRFQCTCGFESESLPGLAIHQGHANNRRWSSIRHKTAVPA